MNNKVDKIWVWDTQQEKWREAIYEERLGSRSMICVNKFSSVRHRVICLDNLEKMTVDSHFVSETEPTEPYTDNRGGEKLLLRLKRKFVLRDEVEITSIYGFVDTADLWEELLDAEMDLTYVVTESSGYRNKYLCSYCEKYSSNDHTITCIGCNTHGWWRLWSEVESPPKRLKVGDILKESPGGMLKVLDKNEV